MRIAINARSILLKNRTGIGRYTFHLLDSLGMMDKANEYWLYARQNFFSNRRRLPNFSYPHFMAKTDFLGLGPQYCLKGVDIYHDPSPGPLVMQGPKMVVTIHDLIYKMYPQSHTSETIDLTQGYMEEIVKKADRIICTSHTTREDFHRFFDFSKEKTSVIYNGVDHKIFYKLGPDQYERAQSLLAQKGIEGPFILFVGTIEPRKNLTGVLEALAVLVQKKIFAGKLVVVGMKGWGTQPIESLISRFNLQDRVILTGFIDDQELCFLYNLAQLFVFPSFYEGFGFPIVEAFCCGAPVVTSNTSSCAEIAGDCALTVDPQQIPQIAQAMRRLLEDRGLNQALRQKAMKKAQEFSFLKTAQKTLNIYDHLYAQ